MKARFLLALAAVVLSITACGDSITAPGTHERIVPLLNTDSTTTTEGPGWGSGNNP